jgi:hypothetical protein
MERWFGLITTIIAVFLTATARSASPMNNFRPPLPSGTPAGYVHGVFLEFSCGADGGGCGIRFQKAGGGQSVLASAPFGSIMIDGDRVPCGNSPPNSAQCGYWPKALVPGSTRVRMPYWWTRDKHVDYTFAYTERITTIK